VPGPARGVEFRGLSSHKPGESGAFGLAFVKKILGRPCRAWEFIGRGDPGRWPGLVWNAPLALLPSRGALPPGDACTASWVTTCWLVGQADAFGQRPKTASETLRADDFANSVGLRYTLRGPHRPTPAPFNSRMGRRQVGERRLSTGRIGSVTLPLPVDIFGSIYLP
jgi:hypothetical protein